MDEKSTIIVADDAKINRSILVNALKDDYNIIEVEDGEQTLKAIVENYKKIGVVLLDVNMPRINGFQVMNALNRKNALKYVPIILITEDKSLETMRKGYEYGAVELITKPFDIQAVKSCIVNIIKIYSEKNKLEAVTIRQNRELLEQTEKLRKLNEQVMDMLGTLVEFRGAEGSNHIKRVKELTKILCESILSNFPEYQLSKADVNYIASASCLHDVGKMLIPDHILLKPAKLTPDEYEIVKSHTTKGCEILQAIEEYQENIYFKYSYDICRYHHERYDGNGYPEGLFGDNIPISAQIVSIVEAFDALMTTSVYKDRYNFDKAYQMIVDGECGVFSPKIMQCFQLCKENFRLVERKYTDDE